jgi:hypothetical protein
MSHYYIHTPEGKDGPHDLVTLMRRIHAGKVSPDTLIYIDAAETPVRARSVDDIAQFFVQGQSAAAPRQLRAVPTLNSLLANGWRFTLEHNVMTVYAGGLLLLSIMLASGLVQSMGLGKGLLVSWIVFVLFHNFYLIFVQRLYRGQPFSSSFINQQIAPALWTIIFACVLLSLMLAGGLLLLVLPGILIAVFYVFTPFIILDHHTGALKAMKISRQLLQKRDSSWRDSVCTLVVLHLVCMLLIFPLPVTLPIFAAALAELYEELSAA